MISCNAMQVSFVKYYGNKLFKLEPDFRLEFRVLCTKTETVKPQPECNGTDSKCTAHGEV